MGSLIEELQRREAAARREADELRSVIARLNERLAQAGSWCLSWFLAVAADRDGPAM